MKIRAVSANNRRKAFEVRIGSRALAFPFLRCDPPPTRNDPVRRVEVDPEIAREGFTYRLQSGREGTVHVEQVLEYNQDPAHLRDAILYRLTLEAQKRLAASRVPKRALVRRLGTSAAQLYRLLDVKNTTKSVDQMLRLLHALDCDVELVVRAKPVRGAVA